MSDGFRLNNAPITFVDRATSERTRNVPHVVDALMRSHW